MDDPKVEGAPTGPVGPSATPTSIAADVANPPTDLVPAWLRNVAALGWRVLVVVALVVVAWFAAGQLWVVSATIVVSAVIAAVMAPSVVRLRAGGRSRNSATLIVWGIGLLVALGLLVLLLVALAPHVAAFVQALVGGAQAVEDQLDALDLPPVVASLWHEGVELVGHLLGDSLGGVVETAASIVTVLILSVFLIFFLLRDGDRAWLWVFQGLPGAKQERITAAGRDALLRVGGYLRGTTIIGALMALTTFLFLVVLGIPFAGPMALLVFLAGYVPVVGGIVSTVMVLLVAFEAAGAGTTFLLLVLIAIRNAIMTSFVRPSVYGRTVSIHPAVVLVVLPAGYQLAGIIGLLAAVPVTAVLVAIASAAVAIVEPDPRPPLPGIVPGWLDRFAQWSWRILVVIGLVGIVVMLAVLMPLVVTPLVIALVVTATLDPLVSALIGRGWSRTRATVASVLGSTLAVAGLLVLAVVSLATQMGDIGDGVATAARHVDDSAGGTLGLGVSATVEGMAQLVHEVRLLLAGASAVGTVIVVLLLGLLLSVAFLRDGGRLWAHVLGHAPAEHRDAVDAAGSRALGVLGGYMIGTAAISGVGAASQWLIMLVLGIPLALPVAVLSFILCFIPYIGGFLSTGIAFLLTVAYGSPLDILIMAGWTIVFNIVQGNIVSPLVYGRTVSLHPAIVLLAIPAAGAVAGMVGMFIVVPALGVVAATWRPVLALLASRATSEGAAAPAATVVPSA
jgi:predicted PurR-regulated permease PerM